MKSTLNRRGFLASASALGLTAGVRGAMASPIAAIVAWKPALEGAKLALELGLTLFSTYVDLQREMQNKVFTEAAITTIRTRLNTIADSVNRIESELAEFRTALLGDIPAVFLSEKIHDLRACWGSYYAFLGGKETLKEIDSDHAQDQAVKYLVDLKKDVIQLVEEIKERDRYNPIIVTPIFSAFSLVKAINERLIESRDFWERVFGSREALIKEYNDQLQQLFVRWRDELADPMNPRSLASRKRKLEIELPRAKAAIARLRMLDGDFQDHIVNRRGCPALERGVAPGVSVSRIASCVLARTRWGGIFDFAWMKFALVDTQVQLTSHFGCTDEFFPAELFDMSSRRVSATAELRYERATYDDPYRHFAGRFGCEIQDIRDKAEIDRMESAGELGYERPVQFTALLKVVQASNGAQAEMIAVLSAWSFVKKEPKLDDKGQVVIGVSYQPDPALNLLFDIPLSSPTAH